MPKLLLLLMLAIFSVSCDGQKNKSQTAEDEVVTNYYFIRHAEKVLSDPSNPNPDLTEEGVARAQRWKDYFTSKDIDAVYSTDYTRTMRTAMPTAQALNLEIQQYDPSDMYNEAFQNETKGKNVLIVGHSNTTPGFANAALGETNFKEIDESEYYHLYHVKQTISGNEENKEGFSIDVD